MTARTRIAMTAFASLALIAPTAPGQDALGRGNALDNNLNTQSGGRNFSQRSLQSEVQLRNALITGNVGGGRQFRGDVGYSSPLDFRGPTGSDDIFGFQTDSFYSGLATQNLRNIGGIQNTFSRSTLGQIGGASGQFVIERPSSGTASGGFDVGRSSGFGADSDEGAGQTRDASGGVSRGIDPFNRLDGTLRSTSAYYLQGAAESPQILRVLDDMDPQTGLPRATTASPLQGVKDLLITNPALGYDEMSEERLGSVRDSFSDFAGRDEGEEASDRPSRDSPTRLVRNRLSSRIENMTTRELSSLMQTDARDEAEAEEDPFTISGMRRPTPEGEEAEADPMRIPSTDELLQRLRDDLTDNAVEFEGGERKSDGKSGDAGDEDDEEKESAFIHERMIDRAVTLLGGDKVTIGTLVDVDRPESTYKKHMEEGQKALKEGRWFDAEERFTAALQARRESPLASAGRINAQIGAGMYRSGALNLRVLYRMYPEMVSVRFDENLLPTAERLTKIRDQLRERMRLDTAFARDAGLLLAYLGFQYESPADVEEGFGVVQRVNETLNADSDPLDAILQRVWSE